MNQLESEAIKMLPDAITGKRVYTHYIESRSLSFFVRDQLKDTAC